MARRRGTEPEPASGQTGTPAQPAGGGDPPASDPPAPPDARPAPVSPTTGVKMPTRIFVIALLWMLALTAVFFVWVNVAAFRSILPSSLGPLPPETIWFGAVGGMLISMTGIYRHNREWDASFDYWHYTRPLLGAFMGVLGCLALILLTKASTTTPDFETDATFYSMVALVIGYREESFRTLLMRVTDLFLVPGRATDTRQPETAVADRPPAPGAAVPAEAPAGG